MSFDKKCFRSKTSIAQIQKKVGEFIGQEGFQTPLKFKDVDSNNMANSALAFLQSPTPGTNEALLSNEASYTSMLVEALSSKLDLIRTRIPPDFPAMRIDGAMVGILLSKTGLDCNSIDPTSDLTTQDCITKDNNIKMIILRSYFYENVTMMDLAKQHKKSYYFVQKLVDDFRKGKDVLVEQESASANLGNQLEKTLVHIKAMFQAGELIGLSLNDIYLKCRKVIDGFPTVPLSFFRKKMKAWNAIQRRKLQRYHSEDRNTPQKKSERFVAATALAKCYLMNQNMLISVDSTSVIGTSFTQQSWTCTGEELTSLGKLPQLPMHVVTAICNENIVAIQIVMVPLTALIMSNFIVDANQGLDERQVGHQKNVVLLLDSAAIHHSSIFKQTIRQADWIALYNCPKTPEHQPIKLLFADIKRLLRKVVSAKR